MDLKPPLPEALDKFSILTLKLQRIKEGLNRDAVLKEHAFYAAVMEQYHREGLYIKPEWIATLMEINGRCWDVEASVRQGKEAELGLEEVGRRALKIREINRERIEYKNKIAEEVGLDFFEVKVDHASASAAEHTAPIRFEEWQSAKDIMNNERYDSWRDVSSDR